MKRCGRFALLMVVMMPFAWSGASAAESPAGYPSKPIRIIVPFSPGGGADALARTLQPALSSALGQSLVLDNRGGASGMIGAELASRAEPDGYTVCLITTTHSVNPAIRRKVPYDLLKDLTAVSLAATQPNILVVHPSVPAKSMKELVALAKTGKQLTFASGGSGSAPHLSGELLQTVAGIDLTHVPFRGSGPGVTALLGGQVSMMFVGPLAIAGHVNAGRLRALAVADKKRSAVLPDVPTVSEAGYAGTEAGTWYGFVAPAGTPLAIREAFHSAVVKAMATPETKNRLIKQGAEIAGVGPREFGEHLRAEVAKWKKLVQKAGIKAD